MGWGGEREGGRVPRLGEGGECNGGNGRVGAGKGLGAEGQACGARSGELLAKCKREIAEAREGAAQEKDFPLSRQKATKETEGWGEGEEAVRELTVRSGAKQRVQ